MIASNLKRPVTSAWLRRYGSRLDASTFISGTVEAQIALQQCNAAKVPLHSLTNGNYAGIYHAGRFGRVWVKDPEYGVPFIGSSAILQADLTSLPLISKEQVENNDRMLVRAGMTLITRSGTTGRTVYARPDFDGLASSEHIIKVVPDESRVPPGYLFAYLSSCYGNALVTSGTYGAIIQHIEPQHIADLPVPRLGDLVEGEAHRLVQTAADLRTQASALFAEAIRRYEKTTALRTLKRRSPYSFSISSAASSVLANRMDAAFSSRYHQEAREAVKASANGARRLAEYVERVFEPTRLKRVKIDSKEHGVPFFGTSALLWADPQPNYRIPRNETAKPYIVNESTVLVPRSGQKGGIIGTAVLPYGDVIGGAVSEHAIRVICSDEVLSGFVYIGLSLETSVRQLKARPYGSSIPSLSESHLESVLLPDVKAPILEEIGLMGAKVARLRDAAIKAERDAIALVERSIAD